MLTLIWSVLGIRFTDIVDYDDVNGWFKKLICLIIYGPAVWLVALCIGFVDWLKSNENNRQKKSD
jgi:hypothetical protein